MSGWTSKRALYEKAFFGSIASPASTDGWFTGVRFFSLSTFGRVSLTIAFATSFATCGPYRRESTSRGAFPGRNPLTCAFLPRLR